MIFPAFINLKLTVDKKLIYKKFELDKYSIEINN